MLHHDADVLSHRDPYSRKRARRPAVVGILGRPTPHGRERAFNGADHVRHRHFVRGPGEPEAAVRPAVTPNDPGMA